MEGSRRGTKHAISMLKLVVAFGGFDIKTMSEVSCSSQQHFHVQLRWPAIN